MSLLPLSIPATHGDRSLAAALVLGRISEALPKDAVIMRGSFYGHEGPELDVQLSEVEHVKATVAALHCDLRYLLGDVERGMVTHSLRRPHMWSGEINALPVCLWAYEELSNPWTEPRDVLATAPAAAELVDVAGEHQLAEALLVAP